MTVSEAQTLGLQIEHVTSIMNLRFESLREVLTQRFKLQDQAQTIANETMELRLDKLNELRSEVLQDRAKYVTFDQYNIQFEATSDQIKAIQLWQSKVYGIVIGLSIIGGLVAGVVGTLLAKLIG